MNNLEILVPITIFVCITYIIKLAIEHKSLRLLINKGEFSENSTEAIAKLMRSMTPASMKWGMVLVGVGFAFLITQFVPYPIRDELTVGFMFIFAGSALIGFYIYDTKKSKNSVQ